MKDVADKAKTDKAAKEAYDDLLNLYIQICLEHVKKDEKSNQQSFIDIDAYAGRPLSLGDPVHSGYFKDQFNARVKPKLSKLGISVTDAGLEGLVVLLRPYIGHIVGARILLGDIVVGK